MDALRATSVEVFEARFALAMYANELLAGLASGDATSDLPGAERLHKVMTALAVEDTALAWRKLSDAERRKWLDAHGPDAAPLRHLLAIQRRADQLRSQAA
jgi:hypothetical protein